MTGSWRHPRAGGGQPVAISLKTPNYAEEWPSLWAATPRWKYFNAPDDEFDRAYRHQLHRYGATRIRSELGAIAEAAGTQTLMLLCWEPTAGECHRGVFATWWQEQTGEQVAEATPATDGPRGEFREETEDGRQIIMLGAYSYAAPAGELFAPGDKVWVPGNRFRKQPRIAVVTGLGSDYAGPLVEITGRA